MSSRGFGGSTANGLMCDGLHVVVYIGDQCNCLYEFRFRGDLSAVIVCGFLFI